jgi:uncharacterized protein (DUF1697 family)
LNLCSNAHQYVLVARETTPIQERVAHAPFFPLQPWLPHRRLKAAACQCFAARRPQAAVTYNLDLIFSMPVLISMLRAINLPNHNKIKMETLRELYSSLKFENPQTYLQSGNVIFKTSERNLAVVAKRIQQAIEKKFACRTEVILRTTAELRSVVSKNPFAKRNGIESNKLLVTFLAADPGNEARENLCKHRFEPEEVHVADRELYIYFPNGMGKSKLPWARIDKILQTPGTGRNWNSVTNMLEIAESLEASP